jgi:two-component system, OmpR family, response regulator
MTLRVLLVEDSPLIAARLAEVVLRLPGVELIETLDTEAEAVSHITNSAPDVLLLDLQLRSGSGFGVLRSMIRMREHRPRVVILTNHNLAELRLEAESLGADVFLDKSRDYLRLPGLLEKFAEEHISRMPTRSGAPTAGAVRAGPLSHQG